MSLLSTKQLDAALFFCSVVSKGKKTAAKPRPTARGNPKKRPHAKKKRTSYDQIKAQLAVINQIKVRELEEPAKQ